MANRMAVRVKVHDRSEYVEVTSEMLENHELFLRHGEFVFSICLFPTFQKCFSLFFTQVLSTFDLDPTQAAFSFLFDQDNFPIPVDLFAVVAPKFTNPSVHLKIVFQFHENSALDLVKFYSFIQFRSIELVLFI